LFHEPIEKQLLSTLSRSWFGNRSFLSRNFTRSVEDAVRIRFIAVAARLSVPPTRDRTPLTFLLAAPSEGVKKSTGTPAVSRGENRWDRQRFALATKSICFSYFAALGKTSQSRVFAFRDRLRTRLAD